MTEDAHASRHRLIDLEQLDFKYESGVAWDDWREPAGTVPLVIEARISPLRCGV